MKTLQATLLFAIIVISTVSCNKKDEVSAEHKQKAEEFKAYIASKQFQIKEFYSDKPIDYVEDDAEVKSETDLWPYVSLWIKDDYNVFDVAAGKVTITQNTHKLEGETANIITRDFSIGADKDGPYFNFLNYQYNPLKYRIVEFSGDTFLVYVDWHSGGRVYTRFQVIL